MQQESINSSVIIELDCYRSGRARAPAHDQEDGPTPKGAEEALKEVARHLLMAVRVITARKN